MSGGRKRDTPRARHVTGENDDAARAERPRLADLLGAAPDWCGDLSVDEFMAVQRRKDHEEARGERAESEET